MCNSTIQNILIQLLTTLLGRGEGKTAVNFFLKKAKTNKGNNISIKIKFERLCMPHFQQSVYDGYRFIIKMTTVFHVHALVM